MNDRKQKLLTLCVLLMVSFRASAGCDSCIQSAANSASNSMSSSLNEITSSVNENVSATNNLNSTVESVGETIGSTIEINHELLSQGISAATNRIELAVQQNTKSAELLNDHLVKSLVQLFKDISVAEQVHNNNKTYDPDIAQPLSGDIGSNRAPLLKQGYVQRRQITQQMSQNMYDWVTVPERETNVSDSARLSALLVEDESVWDPTPIIGTDVITDEEFKRVQKLLTVLITPVPLRALKPDELATNRGGSEYEVSRKLYNAQATLAHAVLAKSVADRLPLIPVDETNWKMGYVTVNGEIDGKTSMMSFYDSETIGRLTSEGWYQDMKTKTEAGVLREQVYMQAIKNKLALRMLKQEEDRLLLESLRFAKSLRDTPLGP